ncbi:hypothetical protein PVAP13_9KG395500 [Panicum virgatum]|uniref:Uncharacterized protein n=1 Tax=Panicum virgatum TaxID=38727 RepID=A0A8T0NQ11_PANVG|nr:hypothetical protein PVAP13_9KG395500 [Panicum virgatum]
MAGALFCSVTTLVAHLNSSPGLRLTWTSTSAVKYVCLSVCSLCEMGNSRLTKIVEKRSPDKVVSSFL